MNEIHQKALGGVRKNDFTIYNCIPAEVKRAFNDVTHLSKKEKIFTRYDCGRF